MWESLEATLGLSVIEEHPVRGGYSHARRLRVRLEDGSTVFVKRAVDADTARWLRTEHRFYTALGDAPFMARCLAFIEGGEEDTTLVLEDLSSAYWPPPWRTGLVDAVLETLEQIWDAHLPFEVAPLDAAAVRASSWARIAAEPEPVLRTGLLTEAWLHAHLPALCAAVDRAELEGSDFIHFDIRSDNLCLRNDQVIVVDWNWSCRAHRRFELSTWLPSLAAEGGPAPEDLLPDGGPYAALLSGFFLDRCAQPPIPHAPRVRGIQRIQAEAALAWTCRALALPEPMG